MKAVPKKIKKTSFKSLSNQSKINKKQTKIHFYFGANHHIVKGLGTSFKIFTFLKVSTLLTWFITQLQTTS